MDTNGKVLLGSSKISLAGGGLPNDFKAKLIIKVYDDVSTTPLEPRVREYVFAHAKVVWGRIRESISLGEAEKLQGSTQEVMLSTIMAGSVKIPTPEEAIAMMSNEQKLVALRIIEADLAKVAKDNESSG